MVNGVLMYLEMEFGGFASLAVKNQPMAVEDSGKLHYA